MSEQKHDKQGGKLDEKSALPMPRTPEASVVESPEIKEDIPNHGERTGEAADFLRSTRNFASAMAQVAKASWLVGIVAVGTLITGIAQCSFNKAQVDEMRLASKLTRETIIQNEKTLNATIAFSRIDQRAWITASETSIIGEFSTDTDFSVRIKVANAGRTPAKMVNIFYGSAWSDTFPLQEDYDIKKTGAKQFAGAVGPNDSFVLQLQGNSQIAKKMLEIAAKKGRHVLYFYVIGIIEYEDIFGNQRITRFCRHGKIGGIGNELEVTPGRNDIQ